MKLTSTFLGNKGLSQSEANHTANICKEIAESIGSEINGASLFKKTLNDKFGKVPYNFVRTVADLDKKCLEEGSIYALSAWLREGIKAKALIISTVQHASTDELGFPVALGPVYPSLQQMPQERDMINELSIGELAEYLMCEAKAAHIGKKIHPAGLISSWRKQLANTPPVEFIQSEKEYMRIDIEPLIDPKEVDNLFYLLQKEHREVESRLNYYKAKLHTMFNETVGRIQSENSAALEKYNSENQAYRVQFEADLAKAEAKRAQLLKEVSDLKIIVPVELQSTLDYVLAFSRK